MNNNKRRIEKITGCMMIILTVFISIAAYSGGCGTALTIICAVCGGAAAVIAMLEAVQLKTKAWLANSLLMLMTGIYILKCTPCDAGLLLIGTSAVTSVFSIVSTCVFNLAACPILYTAAFLLTDGHSFTSETLLSYIFMLVICIIGVSISIFRTKEARRSAEKTQSHEDLLRLLELKKNEAEKAAKAKSTFLAGMSYEIRIPLNTICGMADLLAYHNLDEECADYTSSIKTSAEQMLNMIDSVLDFSKVEAGGEEVICASYQVRKFIEDIISETSAMLKKKDVSFVVNIDPNIPEKLIGDMMKLKKIALNLLSNAVKFTEHGMITLTVSAETISADKIHLTMSVEDTGIGIKAEDMPKLFTEFSQINTSPGMTSSGAGLGLAMAQQLARLMDGKITVESVYGVGSTFTAHVTQQTGSDSPAVSIGNMGDCRVYLIEPNFVCRLALCNMLESLNIEYFVLDDIKACNSLVEDMENTYLFFDTKYARSSGVENPPEFTKTRVIQMLGIQESSDIAYEGISKLRKPLTIFAFDDILTGCTSSASRRSPVLNTFTAPSARALIVDDTASNRKVVEAVLKCYGVRSVSVDSGEKALRLIHAGQQFDVIFMDQLMPHMNGTDVVRLIRSSRNSYAKQVPIIALTAASEKNIGDEMKAAGMNDYISKPIDMALFDTVMRKWIPAEKQIPVNSSDTERSESIT